MVLTFVLTALVMVSALGQFWSHGALLGARPARPRPEPVAPALPSEPAYTPPLATNSYRIQQLEKGMEDFREGLDEVRGEHTTIAWLLVANLAAVVASLVTYIVTRQGRWNRRGPSRDGAPPP